MTKYFLRRPIGLLNAREAARLRSAAHADAATASARSARLRAEQARLHARMPIPAQIRQQQQQLKEGRVSDSTHLPKAAAATTSTATSSTSKQRSVPTASLSPSTAFTSGKTPREALGLAPRPSHTPRPQPAAHPRTRGQPRVRARARAGSQKKPAAGKGGKGAETYEDLLGVRVSFTAPAQQHLHQQQNKQGQGRGQGMGQRLTAEGARSLISPPRVRPLTRALPTVTAAPTGTPSAGSGAGAWAGAGAETRPGLGQGQGKGQKAERPAIRARWIRRVAPAY